MRRQGFTPLEMRRLPKGNLSLTGFTLIEVLASIVLIAVALIPIMIIVSQIIENSLKSERLTKVIFLGESKIEEVKRDVINDFSTSRDESATAFASPYDDYKYTVADDEGTDIKVIQVQVWYDGDGDSALGSGEESITLDAKIADRG